MSSAEQILGEQPPSSFELIDIFEAAHDAVIKAGDIALLSPSQEILDALHENAAALKANVNPILEQQFFRHSRDEMHIDVGVGAFVNSAEDLVRRAIEVIPPGSQFIPFNVDIRADLTNAMFSGDMSEIASLNESVDTTEMSDDEITDMLAIAALRVLQVRYIELVDQYIAAIENTEKVQLFLEYLVNKQEQEQDDAYQKEERIRQTKMFGIVLAASFIGTLLANSMPKSTKNQRS